MKLIDFANVSFSFETGKPILEEISWSQEPGTLRFITGQSGSGKTTLLHLLLGLYRPISGDIWVNGCNLTDLTNQQLTLYRQHIGTVFQNNNLVEHRSVFENMALPLRIRGEPKNTVTEHVYDTLSRHGLLEMSDRMPRMLSSGDQQRVAIARALISEPHILVADEPTGNLDNRLSKFVADLFRQEAAQGRTVIMVTHDDRLINQKSDLVSDLIPAPSNSGASTFA